MDMFARRSCIPALSLVSNLTLADEEFSMQLNESQHHVPLSSRFGVSLR